MTINDDQKRAIDRAPDYDPGSNPEGAEPARIGTLLRTLGDAAAAEADATDPASTQALVNTLKNALAAAFANE